MQQTPAWTGKTVDAPCALFGNHRSQRPFFPSQRLPPSAAHALLCRERPKQALLTNQLGRAGKLYLEQNAVQEERLLRLAEIPSCHRGLLREAPAPPTSPPAARHRGARGPRPSTRGCGCRGEQAWGFPPTPIAGQFHPSSCLLHQKHQTMSSGCFRRNPANVICSGARHC